MAFHSGYKRRHFTVKSSDSESDVPLYKKERITRARKVAKNLQTFCDNDSPTQSTDNMPVTRRSNANNRNCNTSMRPGAVYRTRIVSTSSESDTTTVDDGKITRGKPSRKKKSNVNTVQISESSWNSEDSLIQNKKTCLGSSSATKQNINKQTNNTQNNNTQNNKTQNNNEENSNKDSESEFIDCSQVVENRSEGTKNEEPNIISSTPIGDNRVIEKQKVVSRNFKPHITKVMEEMKCKFSRFISQISRLQQRYFKEETVTLEDAKDIIFILTCIISRLKEEFTEHQHKLMDFCFQSSMKHNSKRTVSNTMDKQFVNDYHLQVQNLMHNSPDLWNASSSNNDEPVFSHNTCVEQTLQATKSSTNNLQSGIKDNKTDNTKSAIESNNHLFSVQTSKKDIILGNSKSALSIFNNITKSNDKKGNIEGSTKDISKKKDSPKTSTSPFRQPTKMTRNLSKNKLNSDDDISHASSDVDSTCSTLNWFSSYKADKRKNNRTASCTNESEKKTKNNVLNKITLNAREDDTQSRVSSCENIFSDRDSTKRSSKEKLPASNSSSRANSLYRIHSLDTMIFPNHTDNEDTQRISVNRFNSEETLIIPHRNAKNCSFIKKKKTFSIDSDDLLYEPDFQFIVPNADNLNKKYRLKYVVDKKLQMECRVLIERCNL